MISAPRLFSKCKLHYFFVASIYPKKKQRNTVCIRCTQVCKEIASFTCNEYHFKIVCDSEETAFQKTQLYEKIAKNYVYFLTSTTIVLFHYMKKRLFFYYQEMKRDIRWVQLYRFPKIFIFNEISRNFSLNNSCDSVLRRATSWYQTWNYC